MSKKIEISIRTSYHPGMDVTSELSPIEVAQYISLVVILRQMVELGREIYV